jgi:hypothetical protein
MITKKQWAAIYEVLDNFDFRRVALVMKHLKWSWGLAPNARVPDESEIRCSVRERLVELYEKNLSCTDTGGFRIERYEDFLKVMFVLTDWEVFEPEDKQA